MKAFCFACAIVAAVTVAAMIAYPFREPMPRLGPQENAAENAAENSAANATKNTAETKAESPAAKPDQNTAANGSEKPAADAVRQGVPGKAAPDNSQPQTADLSVREQPVVPEQPIIIDTHVAIEDTYPDSMPLRPDLSYLAYYVYSEVPPDVKPADTVLQALRDVPEGTPIDEIELAASVLGVDKGFMKAVARIESGFDPKQRTGSYIGLFQLSHYEFDKYGAGADITDSRENAVAATYKFITSAILFEMETHKKPTISDLYLIHQQGTQGAAEHVSHPERIAWRSMCATDEGRLKGEKWCKRAIWQNTLPAIKQVWKSVENLTSGAFVEMWQQRVTLFYAHYSQAFALK
jgi:hypothetical protein